SVKEPLSIDKTDFNKLHSLGWEDKDIFVAAYLGASSFASDTFLNTFKV
ncbi:MAG: hypothetical protein HQK93_08845, partial [Nitrospirae bacterium]|nr:hypothetical protein [Nitrospirota bacterium]